MSAVVGGGYTGLSSALHLAQGGYRVGLGGNGGQVSA
ncbi:FAD-dependent oxidoreductase [Paracoccus sp. PAR01]|nr:FAD-dependent oxidoreductase [Paracoccus sp. PAR01]